MLCWFPAIPFLRQQAATRGPASAASGRDGQRYHGAIGSALAGVMDLLLHAKADLLLLPGHLLPAPVEQADNATIDANDAPAPMTTTDSSAAVPRWLEVRHTRDAAADHWRLDFLWRDEAGRLVAGDPLGPDLLRHTGEALLAKGGPLIAGRRRRGTTLDTATTLATLAEGLRRLPPKGLMAWLAGQCDFLTVMAVPAQDTGDKPRSGAPGDGMTADAVSKDGENPNGASKEGVMPDGASSNDATATAAATTDMPHWEFLVRNHDILQELRALDDALVAALPPSP